MTHMKYTDAIQDEILNGVDASFDARVAAVWAWGHGEAALRFGSDMPGYFTDARGLALLEELTRQPESIPVDLLKAIVIKHLES